MLLGRDVASDKNRCRGRESGNQKGLRRRKRRTLAAEQSRNHAAHGGDAVQRQSLAGLLGGLGLLLHHLHAIVVHLRDRRRGDGRPCSRRIGRLLAEEAKQGSEEEHDVKRAFHDCVALADPLQCYNDDPCWGGPPNSLATSASLIPVSPGALFTRSAKGKCYILQV